MIRRDFLVVGYLVSFCASVRCVVVEIYALSFLKKALSCPLFVTIQLKIEKNIDVMLRIRTRGRRVVGVDRSTELCVILHVHFGHGPLVVSNLDFQVASAIYCEKCLPFFSVFTFKRAMVSQITDV